MPAHIHFRNQIKGKMNSKRPLIFITNDDSIQAPGLLKLVDCALNFGDVIVAAPLHPQSGQSSALTVERPLRISRREDYRGAEMFTVSGTPVDCVKLGLNAIVPRMPDFIFSGINHGSNSGNAIIYSGTMGAVIEGCMVGIPSVGYSLCHHSMAADFDLSLPFVTKIMERVVEGGLPEGVALNVNIPALVVPEGVAVCRAARGHWTEEYKRYDDPHGKPFYWLTGHFVNEEPEATDTDEYWLARNYVSCVPVTPDMTAQAAVTALAGRFTL